MLINRQMDKKNGGTYLQWFITYLAIKKKEILPFATVWMDLEHIILSEISHQRKTNTT